MKSVLFLNARPSVRHGSEVFYKLGYWNTDNWVLTTWMLWSSMSGTELSFKSGYWTEDDIITKPIASTEVLNSRTEHWSLSAGYWNYNWVGNWVFDGYMLGTDISQGSKCTLTLCTFPTSKYDPLLDVYLHIYHDIQAYLHNYTLVQSKHATIFSYLNNCSSLHCSIRRANWRSKSGGPETWIDTN